MSGAGQSHAEQLRAKIDALVLGMADGVQQIRMPDGSGVTFVDIAQAPALLKMLRTELGVAGDVTVRTRISFVPTVMRRY